MSESAPAPGPVQALRRGSAVLVVDGAADNLRLMGELLSQPEVEVSFAKSGEQALRLAARAVFDLAIVDLNLSDIDGFEFMARMQPQQPACEFIFCSDLNDRPRRDRAFAQGAIDFIEKPFQVEVTRLRLATHLERLALRARLNDERDNLSTMVASMPDGVVSLDRQQRIVTWNAAAERIFGVSAAQAVGQELGRFVPQALQAVKAIAPAGQPPGPRSSAASAPGSPVLLQATRSDGRALHVELNQSRWVQGGEGYTTYIVRDVSERVSLLEALREAKDTAERANQAKSRFLANMSHEIRTPMNAVIGMTHLALQHVADARGRDYLAKIQQSAHHLLGIINDILDFSKIEADKLTLEETAFDLGEVLDNFSNLVADKAREKGLELRFDIAPDVPRRLLGDPLRLGQVLINLGNNAVKFTQQGVVELSARVAQRDADQALLRFAVRDSGIGLSDEQQSRLFQSFAQADVSTSRQYGGTGLGLAIAKRLSQMMGGEIGVQSQPGQGATFWFTARLRCGPQEASAPAHAAAQPSALAQPPAATPARVLVVDDNEVNLMIAREILSSAGIQVQTAGDGAQALQCLQEERFDLVLMDMQMPVMDGLEATRRIRAIPALRGLPVVAMTANAMAEDRQQCLDAGMDEVITKPIDPQQLVSLVRQRAAE